MAIKNKAQILSVVPYNNMEQEFLEGFEGIATQGTNKDYATVRVMQKTFASDPKTGVVHKTERTARLTVAKDFLDEVSEGTNINEVFASYGLSMKRIIAQESFEPFYEGQQPKINPASHPTAPLQEVLVDGEYVYHQTKVVDWASDEFDIRLEGERSFGDVVGETDTAEDDSKAEAIAMAEKALANATTPAAKKAAKIALDKLKA